MHNPRSPPAATRSASPGAAPGIDSRFDRAARAAARPQRQRRAFGDSTSASSERAPVPTKAVYLLVVPGFADWEPAHALAELRRHGGYRVEVVGLTRALVESMGGLTIQPGRSVAEVDPTDVAVFILPGGDRWEKSPMEPDLAALLARLDASGTPIAAIRAAR